MQILGYYDYFYKVALTGNITQAAKELYISQPALSKSIAGLEEKMGCILFMRSKKGVTLTPAGEILFETIKQSFYLLNKAQKKIDEIKENPSIVIRIGIGVDLCEYFLLPNIKNLTEDNPFIRLQVQIMHTGAMASRLENGDIDIAISTEALGVDPLPSRTLFELQECFICGEQYQHVLSHAPVSIYDIVMNYPLIMLNKNSRTRLSFEKVLKAYQITLPPVHEIADTHLISQFVQAGFGIGCVTEQFVAEDIKNGKVHKIPLLESLPSRHCTVTWNNDAAASSIISLLVEQLNLAAKMNPR